MLNSDFAEISKLINELLPFNEEILSISYNNHSLGRVVIMTTEHEIVFNLKTRDFFTKRRDNYEY